MTNSEQAADTMAHRIRWFVYVGTERIPHTSKMRGTWGYDATCTCGWDSRTGGGVRRYVQLRVWEHKFESSLEDTEAARAAFRAVPGLRG